MKKIAIAGQPRQTVGKRSSKDLRSAEMVPCVMYGGDATHHFATSVRSLKDIVYTPDFVTAEINLDGKVYHALLKAIQFHPVSDAITHVDFQELLPNKKIQVELPLRLKGTAKGVREGGKLLQTLRKVKVWATVDTLQDEIVADVSGLEMGKSIRIRDLDLKGMQSVLTGSIPVAMVEITRAVRAAQAAAAASEKGGKKK